jgi:hypothetical protein
LEVGYNFLDLNGRREWRNGVIIRLPMLQPLFLAARKQRHSVLQEVLDSHKPSDWKRIYSEVEGQELDWYSRRVLEAAQL